MPRVIKDRAKNDLSTELVYPRDLTRYCLLPHGGQVADQRVLLFSARPLGRVTGIDEDDLRGRKLILLGNFRWDQIEQIQSQFSGICPVEGVLREIAGSLVVGHQFIRIR